MSNRQDNLKKETSDAFWFFYARYSDIQCLHGGVCVKLRQHIYFLKIRIREIPLMESKG